MNDLQVAHQVRSGNMMTADWHIRDLLGGDTLAAGRLQQEAFTGHNDPITMVCAIFDGLEEGMDDNEA